MLHKKQITSLEQLIEILDNSTKDEYRKLGKRLNIPLADFADYMHFEDEFYTRNCIKRTDDYELILLCWEEGQKTPIHCHNNQECWVHVLKGGFHEERFQDGKDEPQIDQELDLMEEGISYMNDDMGYHSLENSANGRSISLHLYMDPIDECNVYVEDKEEFVKKELEYYSVEGEVLEEVSS